MSDACEAGPGMRQAGEAEVAMKASWAQRASQFWVRKGKAQGQ